MMNEVSQGKHGSSVKRPESITRRRGLGSGISSHLGLISSMSPRGGSRMGIVVTQSSANLCVEPNAADKNA